MNKTSDVPLTFKRRKDMDPTILGVIVGVIVGIVLKKILKEGV